MRAGPLIEFAVVGALCALAYFVVIPAEIPVRGAIGLRADVVPRAAVIAIALFAFLHLVTRLTMARPAPDAAGGDDGGMEGEGEALPPLRHVAMVLAAIGVGYGAIIALGLVAGGVITVLAITLSLGERRPLRLILHGLGGAAVAGLIPFLGL